jgi:hypothetical protein
MPGGPKTKYWVNGTSLDAAISSVLGFKRWIWPGDCRHVVCRGEPGYVENQERQCGNDATTEYDGFASCEMYKLLAAQKGRFRCK